MTTPSPTTSAAVAASIYAAGVFSLSFFSSVKALKSLCSSTPLPPSKSSKQHGGAKTLTNVRSVDSASATLEAVLKRELSSTMEALLDKQKKLEDNIDVQNAEIANIREHLVKQKEVVEVDSDPERNTQLEESTESD